PVAVLLTDRARFAVAARVQRCDLAQAERGAGVGHRAQPGDLLARRVRGRGAADRRVRVPLAAQPDRLAVLLAEPVLITVRVGLVASAGARGPPPRGGPVVDRFGLRVAVAVVQLVFVL